MIHSTGYLRARGSLAGLVLVVAVILFATAFKSYVLGSDGPNCIDTEPGNCVDEHHCDGQCWVDDGLGNPDQEEISPFQVTKSKPGITYEDPGPVLQLNTQNCYKHLTCGVTTRTCVHYPDLKVGRILSTPDLTWVDPELGHGDPVGGACP